MFRLAHTDDSSGDCGMGKYPGDSELRQGHSEPLCDRFQLVHNLQVSAQAFSFKFAAAAAPIALVKLFVDRVVAGQKTGCKRTVGDNPDAVLFAKRQNLFFRLAAQDRVGRLQRVNVAHLQRGFQKRHIEVADADILTFPSCTSFSIARIVSSTGAFVSVSGQCIWYRSI